MFLEVIIILAIGIILTIFNGFIVALCDKYTNEGLFLVTDKVLKNHYKLKVFRIFFWFVFVLNNKWKKGLISKVSFWQVLATYGYFVLGLLSDIIFFFVTGNVLRTYNGLIFIIVFVIVPLVLTFIVPNIVRLVQPNSDCADC